MRHFRQMHASYQCAKRKQKRMSVDIAIERYYIYAEFTKNNHLNDEHTISSNKIFEALLMPDQP